MANAIKTFDGKRFVYSIGEHVFRKSSRDYKYACVAKFKSGTEAIISLGNNAKSTYNSMACFYGHCELRIETL